jgi:hypothetical protein
MGLFGYKKPDLHGIDRKSPLGHLLYHFALGPEEGYTKDSDRWDIANALIDMNDKRAVPVLVDMIRSKDPKVVQSGAMVLGPLGDPSAITPVREVLGQWEHREPPFPANYLRGALEQLEEAEKRREEYERRGPKARLSRFLRRSGCRSSTRLGTECTRQSSSTRWSVCASSSDTEARSRSGPRNVSLRLSGLSPMPWSSSRLSTTRSLRSATSMGWSGGKSAREMKTRQTLCRGSEIT